MAGFSVQAHTAVGMDLHHVNYAVRVHIAQLSVLLNVCHVQKDLLLRDVVQ